jgi:Mlc titration factor MtfA (ptsG expression regulator)
MQGLIIVIVFTVLLAIIIFKGQSWFKPKVVLPAGFREILYSNVAYYRALNDMDKIRFEQRIKDFLSYIKIEGVNTKVAPIDTMLIASSAVIPTFGFKSWRYYNLRYVLLYEGTFDKENFSTTSFERNTLGMVGSGAMQQMMILSKSSLREGFLNAGEKYNTGIHEFVHLLDKADGSADGVPEQLINKENALEWNKISDDAIEKIRKGESDINPYGATNKTEFFAVISEFFFQRPDLLKHHHPQIFEMLQIIFNQTPKVRDDDE